MEGEDKVENNAGEEEAGTFPAENIPGSPKEVAEKSKEPSKVDTSILKESSKVGTTDQKESSKVDTTDQKESSKVDTTDQKESSKIDTSILKESSKVDTVDRKESSKVEIIDRKDPSKVSIRSATPDLKEQTKSSSQASKKDSGLKFLDKIEEPSKEKSLKDILGIKSGSNAGGIVASFPASFGQDDSEGFFKKRNPFMHNPPQPEERRPRYPNPRTPIQYIVNLREDLADFQETHGLPRSRDYSFLSLGLALAQETARAIYSVLLMIVELFPILAIVSLILRFALDKLIEILETAEPMPKLKKSLIFVAEMIVILIPLWILIGSIVIPLISLILSMFAKMFRLKKGKRKCAAKLAQVSKKSPVKATELPYFLFMELLSLLEKL